MNVFRNSGKLVLALAVAVALSLASHARAADNGKVTGKVLDKDGKGVAGVKVRLVAPTDQKGHKKSDAPTSEKPAKAKGERPKPVAEGTSESDGSFTLADVPVGDYVLMARGKGQGAGQAREKVTVKAGETSNVELKLQEGKRAGGGGGAKKEGKKEAKKAE
jgi:hypothetical protein